MGAFQMASINVGIMLITMICIPIEIVASIFFFRYVSKKFEEIEEHEAQMTSVLEGSINGVRVVKAFAKEKYEIDRFNKKSYTLSNENKKLNRIMGLYWGFSDGFVSLQYALTLGYCIYLAQSGLKSSDMIVCISYISMLVYPIRNLGRIISDFGKASVASKRIDEILSLDDEYKVNGTLKPEIKGNIEFKNVKFGYDKDKIIINDFTAKVKAGEKIAIVGPTGAGKTTMVNLLMKFYDINDGDILIDGTSIRELKRDNIHSLFTMVLQDTWLFEGSVYDNIAYGMDEVTLDEVKKATKAAHIHNFIESLPNGYDTIITEDGINISKGQKQLLTIARAMLLNANMLILDEATSNVDTRTEIKIQQAMETLMKGKTCFIIAHRLSTIQNADLILVVNNGNIIEKGTHKELLLKKGFYYDLHNSQFD